LPSRVELISGAIIPIGIMSAFSGQVLKLMAHSVTSGTPLDMTTMAAQVQLLLSAAVSAFLSHSFYRAAFDG
jgi:hypothetical protein